MQAIKQLWLDKVLNNRRLLLFLLLLFAAVNWLLLLLAERIGPPDFYKLFGVSERLFSGDLKVGIVPPLFPLLLWPLGKLLTLFMEPPEAFILAGRLISLFSGLGVLWLSYKFLEKITGKTAMLGVTFLVISPWFLKLISFPITDMLYLFFVTGAFYAFLNKSRMGVAIMFVGGGVLTRFEGVLLLASGAINYFKLKKRYVLIMAGIAVGVLVVFLLIAPRIFAHLKDIILPQKSYLYIFLHPLDFFNLLYGNILFFIPYSYPYLFKMGMLLLLFVFFVYGFYRLFKRDRNLALAMAAYELLFFVAKGYINTADPEREFRRLFSGIWIFYIISFIGCFFLLKKIKPVKIARIAVLVGGGIILTLLAVSQKAAVQLPLLFLVLLAALPIVYSLKHLSINRTAKILGVIVLLVFAVQIFHSSYHKSEEYVISYARKAAYSAAQWINLGRLKQGAVILCYTDNNMVNYYLDKKRTEAKNIQRIHFTVPMRNTPETRQQYIQLFFNQLAAQKVDYIIFDHYVVQKPEFLGVNDVQKILWEERENKTCFRIRQNLFYKGKNVGYVLKPVHAETNH